MSIEQLTGQSAAVWTYDTKALLGSPGGFGAVFAGRSSEEQPVAVKRVALGHAGISRRWRGATLRAWAAQVRARSHGRRSGTTAAVSLT